MINTNHISLCTSSMRCYSRRITGWLAACFFVLLSVSSSPAWAVAAWDIVLTRVSASPAPSGTAIQYEVQIVCSAVAEPSCDDGQVTLDIPDDTLSLLTLTVVEPNPLIQTVTPTANGATVDLISAFPAGASGSFIVEVTAPNGLTPDGYSWTVDADIDGSNASAVMAPSADGSATASGTIAIYKWGPFGPTDGIDLQLNRTFRYTIIPCDPSVAGFGELWLDPATLTDTLPAEAVFVAASTGGIHDGSATGGVVTWSGLSGVGGLECDDALNSPYWVDVTYPSPPVASGTTVINNATISGVLVGEATPISASDSYSHGLINTTGTGSVQKWAYSGVTNTRSSTGTQIYAGPGPEVNPTTGYWRNDFTNTALDPLGYEMVEPLPCLDNEVNGSPPYYASNAPGDICANPAYVVTNLYVNTGSSSVSLEYTSNAGTTGIWDFDPTQGVSLWPIGLPAGEVVAEVRATNAPTSQLQPGSSIQINVYGHVVSDDPAGLMPENARLINTMSLTYFSGGAEVATITDDAYLEIILPDTKMTMSKIYRSSSSRIDLFSRSSSFLIRDITFTDLLPEGMEFVGLSSIRIGSAALFGSWPFQTTFWEVIPNYLGTGRQLVRATAQDVPPLGTFSFQFNVSTANMVPGTHTNLSQAFSDVDYALCPGSGDPLDLDGDGDLVDAYCEDSEVITIPATPNYLLTEKTVQGDLDSGFQGFPTVGAVSDTGGTADYQIDIQNLGTNGLTGVVLYDILPYVGDTGVSDNQLGSSRDSDFQVVLTSLLSGAPAGASIEYSDSTNPCRTEVAPSQDGVCINDWTGTPDVLADVRAFKLSIPTFSVGASATLSYAVQVSPSTSTFLPGDVAWNSFAVASNETLTTEPPKVGLAVPASDISVTKTVNGGASATVETGETFSFEITVRHDTTIVTNADGSASYLDIDSGLETGAVSRATSVVLSDLVPAGMTIVSASPAGAYNLGTDTWTVGDIYPDQSFTLTLTATVASVGSFTNGVHVTANSTFDLDSTPNNWAGPPSAPVEDDEATALVTAVIPAIDIQKQVEDARNSGTYIEADTSDGLSGDYLVGESVRYRFVVTNPTGLTLTDVLISDPLIDGFCDPLTLDIGTLAGNASVTVDCEWPIGFADTSGPIVNTATVTANYGATPLTDSDDAQVQVSAVLQDMGDLPSGYPTLFTENGPRHVIVSGINLGGSVDDDSDGIASAGADGDDLDGTDDENGVSSFPAYSNSGSYYLSVAVTNTSSQAVQLVGWIDFGTGLLRSSADLFGGSGDAGDGTFTTGNIPAGFSGNVILQWSGLPTNLPTSASTTIYARFRLTSDPSFLSDASPAVDGPALDGEVEDYVVIIITTPITMGYFHAHKTAPGELQIDWQTVTETSHLGFNVYVKGPGNQWKKLNPELIMPAAPGDSFETREYRQRFTGVKGRVFALGDVDVHGKETIHGPFKLNQAGGVDRAGRAGVDWPSIKAQRALKVQQRHFQRKAQHQKRTQEKLNKMMRSDEKNARRLIRKRARHSTRPAQLNNPADTDRAHEQLEQENERCEDQPACAGTPLGSAPAKGDNARSPWASRVISGLLSVFISPAHAVEVNEPVLEPGVMYIRTDQTGIYRITYEELVSAGVDLAGLEHTKLSLSNHGESVYLRSWGQKANSGDKRYMGPGGGFEFVAKQYETLYSTSNVYALHIDKPELRRVIAKDTTRLPAFGVEVDYYQHTYRLEPENAYATGSPNGDPWFAAVLGTTGAQKQWNIPFELDHYAPGHGKITTDVSLWGYTSGSHQVRLSHAGQTIDERYFNGIEPITLNGALTGSGLQNGQNTYTLTIPGRGETDYLGLDAIEVTYPRFTRATDQRLLSFQASGDIIRVDGFAKKSVRVIREQADGQMVWIPTNRMQRRKQNGGWSVRFAGTAEPAMYYAALTNTAYRLVAELQLPENQPAIASGSAPYLVISHSDFIDSNMDRLVQARRAQGYGVKVVDVAAIYTHFGQGHFGAQPIRDYIAWAHANLGTEMVLLVGDDMFDYHHNNYADAMSFIPSIYAPTGPLIKIAPVDAKYVDFDDDDVPDIPIGRLTPRTADEWSAMVDKTLKYAVHSNPASIVLSADRYDLGQQYDFTADSAALYSQLPSTWQSYAVELYIDELGVSQARSGLLDALNTGPAIASFVGHSGPRDWSFDGLLTSGDITHLTNYSSPFVVTQWGCWNTYYASPNGSLANAFLSHPNGGAAGVLGAVSLTQPGHERELGVAVYAKLFQPGMTIGDAVLQAKQAYARHHSVEGNRDVLLGLTLLADPALMIAN